MICSYADTRKGSITLVCYAALSLRYAMETICYAPKITPPPENVKFQEAGKCGVCLCVVHWDDAMIRFVRLALTNERIKPQK